MLNNIPESKSKTSKRSLKVHLVTAKQVKHVGHPVGQNRQRVNNFTLKLKQMLGGFKVKDCFRHRSGWQALADRTEEPTGETYHPASLPQLLSILNTL